MHRYTVQVDPPVINWYDRSEQIHWHFTVEARSPGDAVAMVQNGENCRGMPARVVPPLG